jgi:hypothetical protein
MNNLILNNKYNIGDKVDYVNGYGVLFEDKTIVGFEPTKYGMRYYISPTKTPWLSEKEAELFPKGEYKPNLVLNNGSIAEFIGCSDWCEKLYSITYNENVFKVVLVDGVLHTISDYDEPLTPLKKEFQPAKDAA